MTFIRGTEPKKPVCIERCAQCNSDKMEKVVWESPVEYWNHDLRDSLKKFNLDRIVTYKCQQCGAIVRP